MERLFSAGSGPGLHQWDDCYSRSAANRHPDPIKVTLTVEASLGEVIAVLVVGSLLNLRGDQSVIAGVTTDFSHHILISLAIGVAAGAVWSRLWPLLAGQPYVPILNLGVVLGVYSLGDYAGGSGLLTVLIFGVTLANLPRTPHMTRQGARLLAFHAESASWCVLSSLFCWESWPNLSAGITLFQSSESWQLWCWRDSWPCRAVVGWSAT